MTTMDPSPDAPLGPYTGGWRLDAARTTISFHTKAMWVLPVKGTAKVLEGDGAVDAAGAARGKIVVDATSIATGIKKRDAHLQSPDFLDTANHPTIDFDITAVRRTTPGHVAINGQLTIRGSTNPVVVDADLIEDADGIKVRGAIDDLDRSEWGVAWAKMGASLHNRITVRAHLDRL